MKTFVQINPAGVIVHRVSLPDEAPDPLGMIAGPPSDAPYNYYWADEWLPRPDSPAPMVVAAETGVTVTWEIAGHVEVTDAETGAVFGIAGDDGESITVTLPDAGAYRLELTPSGFELPRMDVIEVAA